MTITTQIPALGHLSLQYMEYLSAICPRQLHFLARFTLLFLAILALSPFCRNQQITQLCIVTETTPTVCGFYS